jgi:hypothetical protein
LFFLSFFLLLSPLPMAFSFESVGLHKLNRLTYRQESTSGRHFDVPVK